MRSIVWITFSIACTDRDPRCGDFQVDDTTEACDDGNTAGGDGCSALCLTEPVVTVSWAFYPHVGGPEMLGACRDGVTTVEIVDSAGGEHRLPCDERREANVFVPLAEQILVRLRAADRSIVADSLPGRAVNRRFFAQFFEDAGYLRISYELTHPCLTSSQPLELTMIADDGTATVEMHPCSGPGQMMGILTSLPHRAGLYDVKLLTIPRTLTASGVRIDDNNTVTELLLVER